ncbi:hypothetical protein NLG97_g28 [Lecanicillium saksenae]|uniref:Uncharacterized protein n=1 Tax=Lecanicillium saksenae TaxID=468837 RepID=A0ACC1R8B5_9HYPO|nr:hypothetical protein NLG97_g28 [Lecanicillium saksenae]
MVATTQLSLIAKGHGRMLAYGDTLAAPQLWARHAQYHARVLSLANASIMATAREEALEWIIHLPRPTLGFDKAARFPTSQSPFQPQQRIIQVELTQLRHQIATGPLSNDRIVLPLILALFNRLTGVDVTAWVEKASTDGALFEALGRIHHDVVWLYALLVLPRTAMLDWARTQEPVTAATSDEDEFDSHCAFYRNRLLSQLRRVYSTLNYSQSLNWPLIVAGVACTGDLKEEQEFIDGCLYDNWQLPTGTGCIIRAIEKLPRF